MQFKSWHKRRGGATGCRRFSSGMEPIVTRGLMQILNNLEFKSKMFDFRVKYVELLIEASTETPETEEEAAKMAHVNEQYTAQMKSVHETEASILPWNAKIKETIMLVLKTRELEKTLQRREDEYREKCRREEKEKAAYMERARKAVVLLKQANKIYQRSLPPSITPKVPAGLLNQSEKTYQRTLPTWIAPPASFGGFNSIRPFRRTGELYINPKAIQSFGSNYITFDSYHRHTQYEDTAEKPSRGVVWKYDGGGWRGIVISGIPMDSPEACVNCEHRRKAERKKLIQNSKALRARRRDSESE